jgi:glutathione S-transferase
MLEIFHAPRTRSMRVIWMAEELGLPYTLKPVSLREPSAEFLKANPARSLPAIIDDGVILTESVAILMYLGERYGPTPLAPKPDAADYCDYLQFLVYGEASMAAFLNPLILTRFMAPEDQKTNFTATATADMFTRRLALVDQQLGREPYMAGEAFTAADISVIYALDLGEMLGLADRYSERIGGYRGQVKTRAAYQAATAK